MWNCSSYSYYHAFSLLSLLCLLFLNSLWPSFPASNGGSLSPSRFPLFPFALQFWNGGTRTKASLSEASSAQKNLVPRGDHEKQQFVGEGCFRVCRAMSAVRRAIFKVFNQRDRRLGNETFEVCLWLMEHAPTSSRLHLRSVVDV